MSLATAVWRKYRNSARTPPSVAVLCCAARWLLNLSINGTYLHPDNGILDSGARLPFSSLHPASSVSVAGNRPAPSLFFPSEVGCVDSVSFSIKRIQTHLWHAAGRHGGRRTRGRLNSEPLSQFHEVKGQDVSVNKEGIVIYCKMGHANPHLCVFPSPSYLSLIIALPAEGQGG